MRTSLILPAAAGALALAILTTSWWRAPDAGRSDVSDARSETKKANLNFILQDLDGREVNLAEYQGKVLLLDFWATWCIPCRVEIPGFVRLYDKYRGQGFEVLGVVLLDRFTNAKPFAQQFHINYAVLDGTNRTDVEDAFGPMSGLPTSFLIDRAGTICHRHEGLPRTSPTEPVETAVEGVFDREIAQLLKEPCATPQR